MKMPWRKTREGLARRAANQRKYRERHPERVRDQQASWHERHPDYERDRSRARYASDPTYRSRVRAAARAFNTSDAGRTYFRAWAKTPKGRAAHARRVASLRGAPIRDLTATQWADILAHHDGRCAYCFQVLVNPEQDHVVPLSRGGSHTAANVVPACRSCNRSKGARTPSEWLNPGEGGSSGVG